ncbi:MAG: flagellar biosynthesis protein FlhB [Candidatus Methylomirabilales bacterium]
MVFEDAERTEAATPRRRQEAREQGQVARSPEVTSALLLLATFGALALGAASAAQGLLAAMRGGLALGRPELTPEALPRIFLGCAGTVLRVVLPIALAGAAAGLLANLVQVGFLVTPKAVRLEWGRLDPWRGLRRLVSLQGAVDTLKALLKLAVLAGTAYLTLRPEWGRLPLVATMPLADLLRWQVWLGVRLGLRVVAAYALLALADYGYQRWQHERGLRMTKREVREEARQQEPSPQLRQRMRRLQQERAAGRMMQAVPSATVVVVNPTHLAVALLYRQGMRAPTVVAKGRLHMAERIVAAARRAGVPVLQDVPLARALFKLVEVGGEVPVTLYKAVARILAYVYARKAQ